MALDEKIAVLQQQFKQELVQLNVKFSQENKQLRDVLKDFIQQVRQQNEKNTQLFAELKQAVNNLQEQKLNRQDLASLFSELVPRLGSELAGIAPKK